MMLLPRTCPICSRAAAGPCSACAAEIDPAPALPAPLGVDRCTAAVAYEGAGRELVARFKYRNRRSGLPWLASALAARLDPRDIDAVTWVPTTARRRRARGFDQAELLARAVARRIRRPCRRLLARQPGATQTGRDAATRRSDPPRFRARRTVPGHVLLVDDVVTTGATVTAAAHVLRAAGAATVHVAAAARTPPRLTA